MPTNKTTAEDWENFEKGWAAVVAQLQAERDAKRAKRFAARAARLAK